MNFSELKTELAARGFDYLSDTRRGQYVNWARAEVDEMALWPYREKGATGAAPLTVSDLGTIEAVTDETNDRPLKPADFRTLLEWCGDLGVTGTPEFYYVGWPAAAPVVATYPVGTVTIGVQYWKVTPDLTGTDTPLAPSRFHRVILDVAVRMAYRDADNHQAAQLLQVEIDRGLAAMTTGLLVGQVQGPMAQQITFASEDW